MDDLGQILHSRLSTMIAGRLRLSRLCLNAGTCPYRALRDRLCSTVQDKCFAFGSIQSVADSRGAVICGLLLQMLRDAPRRVVVAGNFPKRQARVYTAIEGIALTTKYLASRAY